MKLIEYADSEMMAINLANQLAGDLNIALENQDRVTFVVPGGHTPGPVFDALCASDLDWARVDVMLSDERWVPDIHIRSNAKLVRERLLVDRAATARFVPLYRRAERPEDVITDLISGVKEVLPISVLLLGMGDDMHTASLFPGAEGTHTALQSDAPVLVPIRAKAVQDVRVTLSAPVLNTAPVKHIVITGKSKKMALNRARAFDPEQAPVTRFLRGAEVHWAE